MLKYNRNDALLLLHGESLCYHVKQLLFRLNLRGIVLGIQFRCVIGAALSSSTHHLLILLLFVFLFPLLIFLVLFPAARRLRSVVTAIVVAVLSLAALLLVFIIVFHETVTVLVTGAPRHLTRYDGADRELIFKMLLQNTTYS